MIPAQERRMAGFRRCEEFMAWQLSDAFNAEVHRLVLGTPAARRDFRYRDQILEASDSVLDNFREGFLRNSPAFFAQFLDYSISSFGEAEGQLRRGIRKQYFTEPTCATAFQLARRAMPALIGLKRSQVEYAEKLRAERLQRRTRRRTQPRTRTR
jgi:four helix bundle protein